MGSGQKSLTLMPPRAPRRPSTTSPISAAIAGSSDSRMLNVAALTSCSAKSSSRYGIADASAATASPTASTWPSHSAVEVAAMGCVVVASAAAARAAASA